ncbi:MAG TPA: hypothetical protein VNO50_10895 [Pyrinomonadaceae bacterium]|nr:hypothetical protein [Pyrinomonadaceae bacterium]
MSVDSYIRAKPSTGDLKMRLPKDASWDVFRYRKEFKDALGNPVVTELVISNGNFRMNPDVIDAKTRHDVELIKAGAAAASGLIQAVPK